MAFAVSGLNNFVVYLQSAHNIMTALYKFYIKILYYYTLFLNLHLQSEGVGLWNLECGYVNDQWKQLYRYYEFMATLTFLICKSTMKISSENFLTLLFLRNIFYYGTLVMLKVKFNVFFNNFRIYKNVRTFKDSDPFGYNRGYFRYLAFALRY